MTQKSQHDWRFSALLQHTNFSQPFTSFWDRLLGTMWQGSETNLNERYERGREHAQWLVDKDYRQNASSKSWFDIGVELFIGSFGTVQLITLYRSGENT